MWSHYVFVCFWSSVCTICVCTFPCLKTVTSTHHCMNYSTWKICLTALYWHWTSHIKYCHAALRLLLPWFQIKLPAHWDGVHILSSWDYKATKGALHRLLSQRHSIRCHVTSRTPLRSLFSPVAAPPESVCTVTNCETISCTVCSV